MVQLSPRGVILGAVLLAGLTTGVDAQMSHRLKGSIRTDAGEPIVGATIRAERQQVSAIGNSLTWQLPLWASRLSELQGISRVQ